MAFISALTDKERYIRFGKSLKYALYTMVHPFDGFWCITREKKGSMAAANLIVVGMVLIEIMRRTLTNFQFHNENMERFNAILAGMSILAPLLLWSLSNWSLTTLMNGKGRLKDVYIATAYAFAPFLIINAVMIPISHVLAYSEAVIYFFLVNLGVIWSALLLIVAMMQIHDYSLAKTVFSCLLTIFGILVIVFIFMLFFSLISDGIAYFVSLYKEIMFRIL